MPHAGLAALLLGVTVATVLYFIFADTPETPQRAHENRRSYSQRQYCLPDDPDDCTICLSPLTNGFKCVLRNCKHKFHRQCIQQWITSQSYAPEALCPICRSPIT